MRGHGKVRMTAFVISLTMWSEGGVSSDNKVGNLRARKDAGALDNTEEGGESSRGKENEFSLEYVELQCLWDI